MPDVSTSLTQFKSLSPILQLALDIAHKNDLLLGELTGRGHLKAVSAARQAAMYELALTTTYSYSAIARRLNRNHATIIKGIAQHCKRHGLPLPRPVRSKGVDSPHERVDGSHNRE
jgi:chromosomal replication initiation ATPase DnaA